MPFFEFLGKCWVLIPTIVIDRNTIAIVWLNFSFGIVL